MSNAVRGVTSDEYLCVCVHACVCVRVRVRAHENVCVCVLEACERALSALSSSNYLRYKPFIRVIIRATIRVIIRIKGIDRSSGSGGGERPAVSTDIRVSASYSY